jgi:hypothetical protein
MQRRDALNVVANIKKQFELLINKPICVSFAHFNSCNVVITDIYLEAITKFSMKALVLDDVGKIMPVWTIKTTEASLSFVLEDTEVFAIYNGLRIIIGDNEVNFVLME